MARVLDERRVAELRVAELYSGGEHGGGAYTLTTTSWATVWRAAAGHRWEEGRERRGAECCINPQSIIISCTNPRIVFPLLFLGGVCRFWCMPVELTLLAASASESVGGSAVRAWSRDGVIQSRRVRGHGMA
jgi:hypothetical protein